MRYLCPTVQGLYLRHRWRGEDARLAAILSAARADSDWTVYLVKHESHPWSSIPTVIGRQVATLPGDAGPRDLRGVALSDHSFAGSQFFADAVMDFAELQNIDMSEACLNGTSFRYARLCGDRGVDLFRSALHYTDFSHSRMRNVHFGESQGHRVDLSDATMQGVTLDGARWRRVKWSREWSAQPILRMLLLDRAFEFFGMKRGTRISLLRTDPAFLAQSDEAFQEFVTLAWKIQHLKASQRLLAWLFYVLTDYGMNLRRLGLSVLLCWLTFGVLYAGYPVPTFISNKVLVNILTYPSPRINWGQASTVQHGIGGSLNRTQSKGWFAPYYFSMVTLITLGYGDVAPIDTKGQVYCAVEGLLGYIFLGTLVGVISSRFRLLQEH